MKEVKKKKCTQKKMSLSVHLVVNHDVDRPAAGVVHQLAHAKGLKHHT
jgi:hypothetical protein